MKNNLQKELFERGLIEEGDSNKINAFKKAYRADYAKDYNKDFNAKTVRKTLIFSPEEFQHLEEQAKVYNMKLSPFLKLLIFSYLNATFIHPEQELLTDIEHLLREINRRIAESIQYIHLSREIKVSDIEAIKMSISELETSVSSTLNNPPRLEEWLGQQIAKNDMFLPKLLESIAHYLTT